MGFLWILHGLQSPRPHGDRTPVRPQKVRYKVSYISLKLDVIKNSYFALLTMTK